MSSIPTLPARANDLSNSMHYLAETQTTWMQKAGMVQSSGKGKLAFGSVLFSFSLQAESEKVFLWFLKFCKCLSWFGPDFLGWRRVNV